MASISMSTAWDETNALVRREAALLVPVALALIALPGLLLDQLRPTAAVVGGAAGAAAPDWRMLASLLFTLFASLALTLLALRPGISVAEALRGALRRFAVAVGASLLLGAGLALLFAPAAPIILGGEAAVRRLNPAFALPLLLYLIAVVAGTIYALCRLLLVNSVVAAERLGVFATIARAWELTRGLFWRLWIFFAMFLIVNVVATLAVVAAGGTVLLALGRLLGDEGLGRLLLQILVGTVNAMLVSWFYLMLANIYRQLAGAASSKGI